MSGLVRNPNCLFSNVKAHIWDSFESFSALFVVLFNALLCPQSKAVEQSAIQASQSQLFNT